MRRSKLIVGILLLSAVGAAALVIGFAAFTGRLDTWVGRQVVGIVNAHLVPSIAFESLTLETPRRVRILNATLTSPDGTEVLRAGAIVLTLAEFPRVGRPIVIDGVELVDPMINLVAAPGGGFKGLSPFVKRPSEQELVSDGADFRLSTVLELRRLSITNGSLRYDPGLRVPVAVNDADATGEGGGEGGGEGDAVADTTRRLGPMVLDALTAEMDIVPETDPTTGVVWHTLDLSAGPADGTGAARVDARARLDLDTLTLDLRQGDLAIDLDANTMRSLPPELQQLLGSFDARGRLSLVASGIIPLLDAPSGNATIDVSLREFNVGVGKLRFPIDRLELDGRLANHELSADLQGTLLGGRLEGCRVVVDTASANASAFATWTFTGLDLRRLLRNESAGDDGPELAGVLNTTGRATFAGTGATDAISGSGTLDIRQGRLVMLPGLLKLAQLMGVARFRPEPSHSLDVAFDLTPQGVKITSSELLTRVLAARSTGTIGYDGIADLTINAGLLEKLQSLLGPIGNALGRVTDLLTPYRLTGPVGNPDVRMAPLGIGK